MHESDNIDSSRLALISIDGLLLVIPQHEIETLEPVEDINRENMAEMSVGWITVEMSNLPVFNLDESFNLTLKTGNRRIVAVLKNDSGSFALMADELQIVEAAQFDFDSLPKVISTEFSPVLQVALFDEQLICASNAKTIHQKLVAGTPRDQAA
ncbi:MAG: hypothetical protein GY806_10585 [Gammaproteobacteria bacterium]|nr:hypothetical protein [Gammaproteobacteria bacterium]